MRPSVWLPAFALALCLCTPAAASAGDCGGPGCVLALATGAGGGVVAGVLLIPVAVESMYLARGERPPIGFPIFSFVLASSLILPSVLLGLVADRTAQPEFWLASSALIASGTAGIVLGVVSLAHGEGPPVAEGPRIALTPMLGPTRGAALTVLGF